MSLERGRTFTHRDGQFELELFDAQREARFYKAQCEALENDLIRLSHASPSMVLKECHEIIARIKRIAEDALAAHRKSVEAFGKGL